MTRMSNRTKDCSKDASVVIGAQFGDEGKGLVTDYLCAGLGPETLVVRFNGGAQAAHTVIAPDGRRHVFGHIGSGAFIGCPTFLSRFFLCNPLVFARERQALCALGLDPAVYVDPAAFVTTPYDMMVNQLVEESRGAARHGSCGLGIGETIERSDHPAYRLRVGDALDPAFAAARLESIRKDWVRQRLEKLGLTHVPPIWDELLSSQALRDDFLSALESFYRCVRVAPAGFLKRQDRLVFEGAQGLLLDPDYGWFPHVTRSHTGLRHVVALAEEAGIRHLDIHYLTRSYLTRHGAGPMPNESEGPVYAKIHDPTNQPNPYQGALRFGFVDRDLLAKTVARDLAHLPDGMEKSLSLVVTCMDQVDSLARLVEEEKICALPPLDFAESLARAVGADRLLLSYGPTRRTMAVTETQSDSGFIRSTSFGT